MSDAAPASGLTAGTVLSGATLVERVYAGSFCEVWRARGARGDVAVKVATTPAGERMLEAEIGAQRSGGGIEGIAPIFASAKAPLPHFVRTWYPRTLRDGMGRAPGGGGRAQAVRLVADVVRTVGRVHAGGIVHGDLKPENVLVSKRGEAFLTDFGLAREIRSARLESRLGHSLSTEAVGAVCGTLAYLPPEAVKGAEPSRAGDVYALGVMLHEALLGRRPDKGLGPEEMKRLLPAPVFDVLARALAFEPADRYRDARALGWDLDALGGALTATGLELAARTAGRFALAGLAAFFVVLRYVSVVALLASYVGLIVLGFTSSPGVLLFLIAVLVLHWTIRWEGPETPEEAQRRAKGLVVTPGLNPPRGALRRWS